MPAPARSPRTTVPMARAWLRGCTAAVGLVGGLGAGLLGPGRVAGVEGLGAMSARYDCTDAAQRAAGITEATAALRKGELAVMPTDTVYGIAADAFSPEAVTALLAAKG